MAKKKTKKKATKKVAAPKLEKAEDGIHDRLPEQEHYKLLFLESQVKEAKTKVSEQRVAYDLWRLEQSRKQESMKRAIQGFANLLRDREVLYNSTLAELSNKYGIKWNEVAIQQDGTIIHLSELEEEKEAATDDNEAVSDTMGEGGGGNGKQEQPN